MEKKTIYRLSIKVDTFEKPITIFAEDLDLMNLPLVIIKKIRKGLKSHLLTLPDDKAFEKFKDTKTLIIPYTNLIMAEEIETSEDQVVSLIDSAKTGSGYNNNKT